MFASRSSRTIKASRDKSLRWRMADEAILALVSSILQCCAFRSFNSTKEWTGCEGREVSRPLFKVDNRVGSELCGNGR